MIGQNDRRSSEFRFSDALRQYGLWEQVPANLTYTIGQSSEKHDWYYAQTQKGGTWTIKFNLDERPSSGRVYLTASLAGCSGTGSTITVKVNGTQRAQWKPGVNDACVYRSAINSGRHYVYTCDFLYTGLKAGENTVALTYSGGGSKDGVMYDCIKMEAGEQVVSGIADATIGSTYDAKPVKYIHQGRLVIEKDGVRYGVDGRKM
jgi:rhamnogalacturonan endolyase